jgi:hypothetical protein
MYDHAELQSRRAVIGPLKIPVHKLLIKLEEWIELNRVGMSDLFGGKKLA